MRNGIPSFPWMLFTNTIWPVLREIMSGSRAGKHRTESRLHMGDRGRQAPPPDPLPCTWPLYLPGDSMTAGPWAGAWTSLIPLIPCFLRVGWARPLISGWFSVTGPRADLSGEKGHRSSHFDPPQSYRVLNTSLNLLTESPAPWENLLLGSVFRVLLFIEREGGS